MTSVISAMGGLDQGPKGNRRVRSEIEVTSDNETVHPAINATPRKRKRARKAHSDRKFDCTFEGCGKSYSRAEHLYRHQLNHAPKQIYRWVPTPEARSLLPDSLREHQSSDLSTPHSRFANCRFPVEPDIDSRVGGFPGKQPCKPTYRRILLSPIDRPPAMQKVSHVAVPGRHSATTSISSGEPGQEAQPRSSMSEPSRTSTVQSQDPSTVFSIPTELSGSTLVSPVAYGSQASLSMSVNGYSDISLAPVTSSEPAPLAQGASLSALDSMSGMMVSGSTVGDTGFDSLASCVYPIFGSETYNRSPFAMADDFTAWLFNEPPAGSSSVAYPSRTSMVPSYLDAAQLQNQFFMSDPAYGTFLGGAISQHPMSVTSILDPGSPRAIMSEDKRQELLHLMATRFNEAAYSVVAKRKDALMEGDIDDDNHVLSLRMMQTYIGSYWYHFHSQLPILHRPTFVADQAPNLLLLAVMAIGASTLDRIHGPEVTETASELANFIVWHLRWEIFMDADFRPPAKLWVFQALLLLEVYEKMYSTRSLHERAHIHHDTTLTLMRRGSSLIGRSAFDSPASLRDDRQIRSATGSTMTPDFVADESWTHWIKTEATRRVAFAAFVLDSTHATMFGHSAKMVAHELRLPLPCDEALWSATSAGEVARVQSSLHANGVKPVVFLDGLKRTLNGQRVRTNAFGRTIIMAGLLSVSWHMNQRDLQVSSLGVPQALGGRDKWRSALLRAFDNWRRDFDEALGQTGSPPFGGGYRVRHPLDEDNVFESRDVLHGLAHMASHVDVVDCQIYAGAGRLMGRSITPRDYSAAREKMTERWATKASARDATFYALKFLSECLLNGGSEDEDIYSGRDDYLLNRPWVIYVAALVVWCYGFALDGPIFSPPALTTVAEQRHDMQEFLQRVGGVQSPNDLQGMQGRNRCLGLLMILRDGFIDTRWELLTEAANLLGNCIAKLRG
ncbi:hypothetical protein EYZ11_005979 [Aspergillus tanneri]|uniref:C2H2-type domain-containing protein n=1 Tax=Aspergillus tanneri TaxID=1220188 RepID=A0A4S3JJ29_9EURO|nr:hypothetical protein EYZ11_005979 [Aspergillus tanneri]